jgi:CRP/FNR family transcriptional regulator, cyclic AMP receptor protein
MVDPSDIDTTPRTGGADIRAVLCAAAFAAAIGEEALRRLRREMHERHVESGAHVAWKGDVVEHWAVVIDGMVKIEAAAADGRKTTLLGISTGGWFGEAALLGDGRWPFDVIATRATRLGLMPRAAFERLLGSSIAFNHFLLGQLNARLSQFVQRCEHLRFSEASAHVAHCLAELFDARLYPSTERRLALSQQEVAHLVGISRPTANRALHELERQGVLSVAYGRIVVHDPEALQRLGSIH